MICRSDISPERSEPRKRSQEGCARAVAAAGRQIRWRGRHRHVSRAGRSPLRPETYHLPTTIYQLPKSIPKFPNAIANRKIVNRKFYHLPTGLSPVFEMATEPSRGLARFSSILPLLATRITCHHPDRSSNSICRSPCLSRTQSRPRHLPWQTKSQRRPSAIA